MRERGSKDARSCEGKGMLEWEVARRHIDGGIENENGCGRREAREREEGSDQNVCSKSARRPGRLWGRRTRRHRVRRSRTRVQEHTTAAIISPAAAEPVPRITKCGGSSHTEATTRTGGPGAVRDRVAENDLREDGGERGADRLDGERQGDRGELEGDAVADQRGDGGEARDKHVGEARTAGGLCCCCCCCCSC